MNPRTVRRAIERKAQKQARKEAVKAFAAVANSFPPDTGNEELIFVEPSARYEPPTISEARLHANRENARHSTGPKTPQGKAISSTNAIKTALTGRTVLLPSDDAERYELHVKAYFKELAPTGQRETILTQSVADIAWRIERIASLEMAIYAKGRAFFADCYGDEPAAIRAQLVELEIYRSEERELRKLHLYEARLRRQRDRDTAELRFLQSERKRLLEERQELAAYEYRKAREEHKPFDPAALGFVFSTTEIESFIALRNSQKAIFAAGRPASSTSFRRSQAA